MNWRRYSFVGLSLLSSAGAWGVSLIPQADTAWGENIGWVGDRATEQSFLATSNYLAGYLWGENIGLINCGDGPANGVSYSQTKGDIGVNRDPDTGRFTGYAWAENIGWINWGEFDDNSDMPRMSKEGIFAGYVWAENAGWINLSRMRRAVDLDGNGLPDSLEPDSDADGIPDGVETHLGLNPNDTADGAQDADHDGQTNQQEALAGTDPENGESFFMVRKMSTANNQVTLEWSSLPGVRYRIARAATPKDSYSLEDQIYTATETTTVATLPVYGDPEFYRVYVVTD
ncbi:hypothetical protein [Cerasicoccus frondis]|uniref:hypothetical protein n=1 Tax=Cerasicoccus frondis TaxID=490090 RepID=UPI0028524FE6|nr:hypothetical protein [Cerasicoccus frondis]